MVKNVENLIVGAALCVLCLVATTGSAQGAPDLSGSWSLSADSATTFEDAAEAKNEAMNEQRRAREGKKFARDNRATSRNRFQNAANAVEKMIAEDSRSIDWGSSEEVERILTCERIRIYIGNKVAILYDGDGKRLLQINPAGRAYSVSGSELTTDDVGISLTYIEDDQLVIETNMHSGGKLTERYRPGAEGGRMIQSLRVLERVGGAELEFDRIFER